MNLFKIFTLFGFLMNSIQSISVNSIIMDKYKKFIQENNKDFSYSHFLTFKNNIEYIDSFHDDLYEACKNSDLVIIHTEWEEFKALDFKKLSKKRKFAIYDMRNLYSVEAMKKNSFKYYSIGR